MGNLRYFGKALRAERDRKRISRDELARATGLTVRTLARIELDDGHVPTDETLKKLALVLPDLARFVPPAA